VAEARERALPGWALGVNFHLQPFWADYVSLLSALEGPWRASARLAGYANSGYADRRQQRWHTEALAASRAKSLVDAALSPGEIDRLHGQGATLPDAAVPALAFDTEDLD
jgi:hypothetical protein